MNSVYLPVYFIRSLRRLVNFSILNEYLLRQGKPEAKQELVAESPVDNAAETEPSEPAWRAFDALKTIDWSFWMSLGRRDILRNDTMQSTSLSLDSDNWSFIVF